MPDSGGAQAQPSVFEYKDYRVFLADLFAFRKSRSKAFSHRSIVQKAGFASANMLKNVIDRKRNLSPASADKFARAFGLEEGERKYLGALVRYNLAASPEDRDRLLRELMELRQSESPYRLEERHYQLLDHWWHLPICEIATLPDFKDSPAWLAETMEPAVAPEDAAYSLSLLKKLGLIEKNGNRWVTVKRTFKTDPQVASVKAGHFHRDMIRLGAEAISRFPPEFREISGTILKISKSDIAQVKTLLRGFRDKLLDLAANSKDADQVYELNFQFFPLFKVHRSGRPAAGPTEKGE